MPAAATIAMSKKKAAVFVALVLGTAHATASTVIMPADSGVSAVSLGGAAPQSLQETRTGPLETEALVHHRSLDEDPLGGSYEHIGCFADLNGDRVLSNKLQHSDMTPLMCHIHCDALRSAYMALQYGSECWCSYYGNLDYARHGVGTCDMPCTGDDSESCGGVYTFDLYQLEWAAEPTDDEYLNCFQDIPQDRIMGDMIVRDDMTSAVCREHCKNQGGRYYGTQYGNECWCGTSASFWDYNRHGWGVCHMECAGDPSVACGGYNSFSLFRFLTTGDGFTPSPFVDTASVMSSTVPDNNTPTPEPVSASEDSGDDNSSGETSTAAAAGDYTDLLSVHNINRCMHNANPLVWDSDVAAVAKGHADVLTSEGNCGAIFHSDNDAYGENLYMCGYSGGYGCYNAEDAMQELYNDELGDTVEDYGGHATAILWKTTERIGCAVAKCFDGAFYVETLVCNFDPPGNNMVNLVDQVELESKTLEECNP